VPGPTGLSAPSRGDCARLRAPGLGAGLPGGHSAEARRWFLGVGVCAVLARRDPRSDRGWGRGQGSSRFSSSLTRASSSAIAAANAGYLLRVDRKGRPAEHVPAPALTLGLALQPEVLRDIARLPGFRGRGLLARILYSLPENTVGRRRIGAAAVPAAVSHTYHRELRGFVLALAGDTEPAVLRLSTEANARVLDLERRIEPRLAPEADLGHITDWAAKLTGATTRIAGLLYTAGTLRTSWTQPIPASIIDAAARLGHYFLAHALAVFDTMSADPTIDDARAVLDWIIRTNQTSFTRRDAFTARSRSRFRRVTDLDPAMTLLDQHGFIRPGPRPTPTGGRPASPSWEIHPRTAETAQAAQSSPR